MTQYKLWTVTTILQCCKREDDEDPDSCLIWRYGCNGNNIPSAKHGGKMVSLRRLMWDLTNDQPITEPKCAVMRCMNGRCLNPAHIQVMSRTANQRRFARAGAYSKPHHQIARTLGSRSRHDLKLNQEKADEIRRLKGQVIAEQIAKDYGISRSLVHLIWRGKCWAPLAPSASVFTWRP